MDLDYVVFLSNETIMTAIQILLPILGSAMLIGVLIGIFQATTSIQEVTLTFIPKIAVVGLVVLLLLPKILNNLVTYTINIFNQIQILY
tara:strand:+ start:1936 stop:2202 length:267 start_codon:yes stop_codon:yes gene_type:complete